MIKTAIRTTVGANKNKNATIGETFRNGTGDRRMLSIIAHQAKPRLLRERAVTRLQMNGFARRASSGIRTRGTG
jgi:hypothetical protein